MNPRDEIEFLFKNINNKQKSVDLFAILSEHNQIINKTLLTEKFQPKKAPNTGNVKNKILR